MGFHGEKRVPSLLEKECLQNTRSSVYLALALCVMVAAFSGCGGKSDDGGNSSAVSSPPATVTPTPTPESQTAKALRVTADSGLNIRPRPLQTVKSWAWRKTASAWR